MGNAEALSVKTSATCQKGYIIIGIYKCLNLFSESTSEQSSSEADSSSAIPESRLSAEESSTSNQATPSSVSARRRSSVKKVTTPPLLDRYVDTDEMLI